MTKKSKITSKPVKNNKNTKKNILLGISGLGITGLSANLVFLQKKNKELTKKIEELEYQISRLNEDAAKKAPFLSFIGRSMMKRIIREKDEEIVKLKNNFEKCDAKLNECNEAYIKLDKLRKNTNEQN